MAHMTGVAQEILALERQRLDAAVEGRTDVLQALLHHNLVYSHSNGLLDTFDSMIDKIDSGYFDYQRIETSEQRVILEGETAVITGRQDAEVLVDSKMVLLRNRTLSVWVRAGESWKLIAFQPTPLGWI